MEERKITMIVRNVSLVEGIAIVVAGSKTPKGDQSIIFPIDPILAPRIGRGMNITIEYES